MTVSSGQCEFETTSGTDILDVTPDVRAFLEASGISDGVLIVFAPGATAGITTIEFEPGALADFRRTLEMVAPRDQEYEHNRRWGDGNGHSHIRAALVGPSLAVPVLNGRLDLGTWQQIVLCDFDNRTRRRRIRLQAIGE
ncbi:MAG: secondary thiamine-phosphate synthase enzyme YjbQ [marine benthic group bacterium]|jgi:secondary thiamine-phosphate synthase enzyme|nr:secondary thiamine-phosphate synthase enzyme YjbQ [Candidatus Benthicola marisminoris]